MKVLIVDDMEYKQKEAIQILESFNIANYEIANCYREAMLKLRQDNFNLLILDLGFPIFSKEEVRSSLEGLNTMEELAYRDINIATIVYSTTSMPAERVKDLTTDLEYPFIGQAQSMSELDTLIKKYLKSLNTTPSNLLVRERKNPSKLEN